jgi:hypothetical protein
MFQKWNWMGVVSELHHSCPSKLWTTYVANKMFWQFFGGKNLFMVLACFLKIFFHASGMFIEKFISSKEWNKVALEFKKKRKKRMLQTKDEGKNAKQETIYLLHWNGFGQTI